MRKVIILAVSGLAIFAAPAAFAGNWTVNSTPFGITVSNSRTNESFNALNEKAARKQAKILNKFEDKQAKQGNGVWDNGAGPCSDPTNRINC